MFTGIVQAVGRISRIEPQVGDLRLRIRCPEGFLDGVAVGDSIAVEGVCLTVTGREGRDFAADVSRETLALTTLGALGVGAAVNLEKALALGQPLGGHLVSGHVDGLGRLRSRHGDARSQRLEFEAPAALARYIARKGSVCVNGVSLTVNGVAGRRFDVNLVPHTLAVTTLGRLAAGARVNLEVDLVARYLERLLPAKKTARPKRKRKHASKK
ncbi:MAG TPA: riboflavin synthase [Nevskiales bacterium]|nr:riboflavin synthase [Nevskiales bacterium]